MSFKTVCKAQYRKGLDGRKWDYLGIFRPPILSASSLELEMAPEEKGCATTRYCCCLRRVAGLRAHKVAQLSLDDIDWRQGTSSVRSKKTRTERKLPLAYDVDEALSDYVKYGHLPCSFRPIFLRVIPPFDPFTGSAAVCRIVRRALSRVGILNTPAAAHLFRHSAATGMLRGGATFKEIADVPGHASIGTTAIYAKWGIAALSHVAMQWPENAA